MSATPDGLAKPEGTPRGPNCGVTAVAVAAGISFAKAWEIMAERRRGNWKGMTKEPERLAALEKLGVKVERVEVQRRATLNAWSGLLDPSKRYIVRTTGHVQVVKGGMMVDQLGTRPVAGDRCGRKFVTSVLLIVE